MPRIRFSLAVLLFFAFLRTAGAAPKVVSSQLCPPRPDGVAGECADLATATFAQWQDAAEELEKTAVNPRNRDGGASGLCAFDARTYTALIKAFLSAEHALARAPGGVLASLDTPAARQLFLSHHYAFVGRAKLPVGARLAIFGDVHGSFISLARFLVKLAEPAPGLNCFDAASMEFRPGCFALFCGDLVDRGPNGPETLALILALRLRNPGRVFVVRGNHEGTSQNRKSGFHDQLRVRQRRCRS